MSDVKNIAIEPRLPLIPGPWSPMNEDDAVVLKKRLREQTQAQGPSHLPVVDGLGSLTSMPLPFYPGLALIQGEVKISGHTGLVDLVAGRGRLWVLDGKSDPLHALRLWRPDGASMLTGLDDADTAALYVRFFNGALLTEHGRFRFIDSIDDLLALGVTDITMDIRRKIGPLVVKSVPPVLARRNGSLVAMVQANVLYAGALFRASYALSRSGEVVMVEDEPLVGEAAPPERCLGWLRNVVPDVREVVERV